MDMKTLGKLIFETCRDEISAYFPYFRIPMASFYYEETGRTRSIGTDGTFIEGDPSYMVRLYAADSRRMKRGFLHMLFHCLYLHPYRSGKKDSRRWNAACDLAVEMLIEECVSGSLWKLPLEEQKKRSSLFDALGGKSVSADVLYGMLDEEEFPYPLEEIEKLSAFDDHSLWKHTLQKQDVKKWEQMLIYTSRGKERHRHRIGTGSQGLQEEAGSIFESRYDYRRFLEKFTVSREELLLDDESFDAAFYYYGMERYGNLPLIEPLEYKEVNRLEELVIAIDTSGSCSKELVQRFLGETYKILSSREHFFQKMNVYVIQCDCCIQSVAVIHSREEWEACAEHITIQGRGGTDFRPVFRLIQKEREKKQLQHLKALLYFTDGDGIYPREKPGYETAFVFVKDTDSKKFVPKWAQTLILS